MNPNDLTNRIKKKFTHLNKWAKRQAVSCMRVYNRDLEEYPFICDWIDGDVVIWLYERKKDETVKQQQQFEALVKESVCTALEISEKKLWVKQRGQKKGIQYTKFANTQFTKLVSEHQFKFEVNLSDYLDIGLFLDHRYTRKRCFELSNGKRVLNLFAYTGSFTVYAIAGGALSTTTVDLNQNYLKWAERNCMHNHLPKRPSDRFIVANCLSFIKMEASKNKYDLIICDPPTFSDSKKMAHSFHVNRDYAELLNDCKKCLAKNGIIIFSTNSQSFKLDPSRCPSQLFIKNITSQTIPEDFKQSRIHQCWELYG